MKKSFRQPLLSLAFAPALFFALFFALAAAPVARAADVFGPPTTVDYQGSVLDSNGVPLAPDSNANYNMEFRLYDAQTGGNVIWAEKQLVTVSKGKFSVRLGEGDAITGDGGLDIGGVAHDSPGLPGAFNGSERYLGVTVVMSGQQSGEMQPRLAFLSAPFSYVAGSALVAQSVNQPAGSPPSNLNVGTAAFSNSPMTESGTISTNTFAVLVDSIAAPVTATLPAGTAVLNRQLLVTKKDDSANMVAIAPPGGGTINGVTKMIYLKVLGESVTIQNVGANDWWIVADSRDKTPVGTIISYTSSTPPAGYLQAKGEFLDKTKYPELTAVLSNNWGVPADITKFRVPDLRGTFLRGWDNGRGIDPNTSARKDELSNSTVGDKVGSLQADDFRNHGHTVRDPGHSHSATTSLTGNSSINFRKFLSGNGVNAYQPFSDANDGSSSSGISPATYATGISTGFTGISIDPTGGSETRPRNNAVNYCIKY